MGKGCSWDHWGRGKWGGKPHSTEQAGLREGMASGDERVPGRLGARCEGSGTAGMDGGGTGKRDRQRVPGGKRGVRLSWLCEASGICRDARRWGQAGGPCRGWVAMAGGSAPGRGGGSAALPARPASIATAPRCSSPGSAWQQRRQGRAPRVSAIPPASHPSGTPFPGPPIRWCRSPSVGPLLG